MAVLSSVRVFCFWVCVICVISSAGGLEEEAVVGEAVPASGFYGRVVELTDDSFDAAIAKHDHILVDFYAPWCGHCKRLAPQLDIAAPVLAQDSRPIVLAKIDAEKHSRVASKYKISAFPTLKFFINGFPTDYAGPRKADGIVSYLRRLSAPSIEQLSSEADLRKFVKSIGPEIPLFVGFGLKAIDLEELAKKYRTKAWFAVMEMFSDNVMEDFDFDKGPALVVMRGEYGEKATFYGPFEAEDVAEFVAQNLLPLVTPITGETLRPVKEDGRPVVVAVLDSDGTPEAKQFIKKLKMAAPAYRKFVFTYVVGPEWPDFLRPFYIKKDTKLPTVFVWEDDTFVTSNNTDSFVGNSVESELSKLLHGFKDNTLKRQKMRTPSLYERATANLPLTAAYLFLIIAVLVMLLRGLDYSAFREDQEEYKGPTTGRWAEGRAPRYSAPGGDVKRD
ncbi:hypothetical protein M758_10G047600 [Ceratodon purpureus]|nr:hypothetical protein M758_10G047600 [Ceratodon purpureus]